VGGAKASPRIYATGLSTPLSKHQPAVSFLPPFEIAAGFVLLLESEPMPHPLTEAKSTAETATRDKSAKPALEPDATSSPVDLGCRISAKMGIFQAASQRISKTSDSLAERVGFELASDERVIYHSD